MARIGLRPLAQMCRRVAYQLHAGVDPHTIWSQEARRAPSHHRRQLEDMAQMIQGGHSIADAMSSDGYFPELTRQMVDVGERTGRLDQVMKHLADHYDHMLQLRRTFLAGIAWPMIQLGLGIAAVGLLILILGMIAPASGEGVKLFGLAGPSGLLIYSLVIVVAAGLLALLGTALVKQWAGPVPMMLVIRSPGVGTALRTMALARMSWSLAMALDAGMDARRSMQLALRSTLLPYYIGHSEAVDADILKGRHLFETLQSTGAFPSEFINLLEAAELSGTQSESLLHISQEYQRRAEVATKTLTTIAGVVIWMTVAAVMIAMIIQLFWSLYAKPIYDALEPL